MKYSIISFTIAALVIILPLTPMFEHLTFAAEESFAITNLTSTCVDGVPRVSATWTEDHGSTYYLFQRQFPNSTVWDTTGASLILAGTDATWLLGYGPGVYSYRVQGSSSTTPPVSITIPDCSSSRKIAWGMYAGPSMLDIANFTSLAGDSSKLVTAFFSWSDNFPPQYGPTVRDKGKTFVLFWEQNTATLDQIIAGESDAYIKKFGDDARAYGGPILLAPFHEMNGYWTPWSGVVGSNTPAKVIAAWRHVHDVFGTSTNVRFVWTVNSVSVPDTTENSIAAYYPGDAYVDDVAVDGFNFGYPWLSFDSIFRDSLAQLKQYKKPIYILSMASAPGSGKAAWITDAITVQIPKHHEIVGWSWFNQSKEHNWEINSDISALSAFRAAIPN